MDFTALVRASVTRVRHSRDRLGEAPGRRRSDGPRRTQRQRKQDQGSEEEEQDRQQTPLDQLEDGDSDTGDSDWSNNSDDLVTPR